MTRGFFSRLLRNASGKRLEVGKKLRVEALEPRWLLATFVVNTRFDTIDNNSHVTSLREAIIASNSNNQDDTIILKSDYYKLSIGNTAGQENAALEGDLDILADSMRGKGHKL